MTRIRHLSGTLRFGLWYALTTLPMFGFWEVAHAPLYTLWIERGAAVGLKAALHCTLGDMVIAFSCALAGLLVAVGSVPGRGSRLRR